MNKKVPAGTIHVGARLPGEGRVMFRWLDPPLQYSRQVHCFTTKGKVVSFPITSLVAVER